MGPSHSVSSLWCNRNSSSRLFVIVGNRRQCCQKYQKPVLTFIANPNTLNVMNLETFMNPEAFALILCKHSLSLFIWREIRSERDAGIDGFSENWNNLCNYQRKDMLSKIRELRRNIFTACRYCHCRPRSLRVGLMVWPWITSISLQLAVFQVQPETSRNFCHLGESWQVYRRLSEGQSFHLSDSNTRRSLKDTNMVISVFDRFASGSTVLPIMEGVTLRWHDKTVSRHTVSPP